MNYEEKYKQALERASKLRVQNPFDTLGRMVEHIFPELKESEDGENKRISKEITQFLKQNNGWNREWLAWLEKQGKNVQPDIPEDGQILNSLTDVDKRVFLDRPVTLRAAIAWLEKQGEQTKEWSNEDEYLLKETIKHLEELIRIDKKHFSGHNVPYCKRDIDWLKSLKFKKQGEQKPIKASYTTIVETGNGGVNAVVERDLFTDGCYGEKNPSDKVEPKFKVGDWLQYRYAEPFLVEEITEQGYCNGNSCLPFEWEDEIHLWTIQDAKDGDVLVASDGSIFLFASVVDCACKYYVALATDNHVKINKEAKGGYWETSKVVYPATKEQRELLFSKMKEAGYEWDAEKKEVKKIEQKTLNADEVIAWLVGNIIDFEDYVRAFKKDFGV